MNIRRSKIEKILGECDKHLTRIQSAGKKMKSIMPMDSNRFENLSETEVQIIDQFIFRFMKLQDSMGEKLFRALLIFLDENIEQKPFIDILNRLEKLEIIDDVESWKRLRDIRNELSHQYEDDSEDMSIAINKVYQEKETIETIYNRIVHYYESL